jgi:aminopeptidase N
MSSYLLAFIVSDLEHISNAETKLPADTLHRIWVRPDSLPKAQYALDNSVNVLKALEDYVGVKFPLPKCDSAGIPQKTGAMENWGMVTYRENAMIYEEKYDDIPHTQKLSGVDVISHELAHQFFGDYVTFEWWSFLW